MYCIRKITEDLSWVGGNDRRLAMFEGVYSVPDGVSYNAYLLQDEKTFLLDTVDGAVRTVFFENLAHLLGEGPLDYVVVQHMEPDHSATLGELLMRHPETTVVCNAKTHAMIEQFFGPQDSGRFQLVKEGDTLCTGRHTLHFVMAPMVHWPEVMVSYDETDRILFSADAFGTFGALNGAIFSDEVDFERDYLDEARRYYCNIVGKYGTQVSALLKKAAALDIAMICPLHGFVFRRRIGDMIEKYRRWSSYIPEEQGVMIAYASVYGNTANAADILAGQLSERGIRTVVYDVSVTPSSDIVAAAFRWSHLVFASTTYNAGIFISMEEVLRDLAAHNLSRRTLAFIENGSWAPTAGKLMQEILSGCKEMRILGPALSIRSSLREGQRDVLCELAEQIAQDLHPAPAPAASETAMTRIENEAFFRLSYGIFVLTAKEGTRENGCIINTAQLLTDTPKRITIAVNKQNLTHDMIKRTGVFNLSVLTEETGFALIRDFGFSSGREKDKLSGRTDIAYAENQVPYITGPVNAMISGRVISSSDNGTHTLFVAEVTEARLLSSAPSATYDYYFRHIKPKPAAPSEQKKGFVCKICGYVYEGEELPPDFICPLCKHGAEDFEPLR